MMEDQRSYLMWKMKADLLGQETTTTSRLTSNVGRVIFGISKEEILVMEIEGMSFYSSALGVRPWMRSGHWKRQPSKDQEDLFVERFKQRA
jgi:hypothetical protein